uniref:Argonaute-like protein n=1 Tax=Mycena chlorophos TaxID=658473 RepID=A0ABQ0LJ67_MYCCL|nr:argonaute-like protein [Mycena chlorophos]
MAQPQTLTVFTNSFIINQLPTVQFHQYEAFSPAIPVPSKREAAINKLQTLNPAVFYPRGVYNGKEHLYLSRELPGGNQIFMVYMGELSPPPPPGSPGYFNVRVTRTAAQPIRPSEIPMLVASGPNFDRDKLSTATTVLQLLIRQSINENNPTYTKRATFGPGGKKVLERDGIELWRGFWHSVRALLVRTNTNQMVGQMVITINTTMTAMLYPGRGSLVDLATEYLHIGNVRDASNDHNFSKLLSHLKKRRINVRSTGRERQTRVIHNLIRGPIGAYQFQKDNRTTDIETYYMRTYNIRLRYPTSFGVQISKEDAPFPMIIPAELCYLKPGQLYRKKIPASASADAVRFATQSSEQRFRAITGRESVDKAGTDSPIQSYGQSQYMADAQMMVSHAPMRLGAKMLEHPTMKFGNNSSVMPRDGSWNILGQIFETPAELEYWAFMESLARGLTQACQATGMGMSSGGRPPVLPAPHLFVGNPLNVEEVLERALQQLPRLEMVVILLPRVADEVKHICKYWGNVVRGIPTQCLNEAKAKVDSQYLNNVAIKINARLGGRYARPADGMLALINTLQDFSPMMVVGADVSHPGPGVQQPSFAGLVYSLDAAATQYVALSSVQEPRLEVIKDLKSMMKRAILHFGANQPPPKSILFLRDGVSEGEMDRVQQTEIQVIQEACAEVWQEKNILGKMPLPKLTFIVVVKRHHQRFFPERPQEGDRKGNTRAGLCVEQFRSPLALDFYLQSHAAIQGTPRPAHYSVLHDEIFGQDLGRIQATCFELCHVYAKATRSVSIPAPVYYADLLCSHAKYRYLPNFDFDAASSHSDDVFDLSVWENAFQPISMNQGNRRGVFYARTMWFLLFSALARASAQSCVHWQARRQKSLRNKDLGEPIQLTGKALALQVHHGFGWIAENTTVARKIDLETGKTLQLYKGHTGPVTSLAFYESLLITGSWDKTIKVWDATTKALVSSTDAHSDFVKCLFVLPSLGLLVSGSSDKVVRFWDISSVAEGTPLTSMGSISSHTRPISCLAGVAISETSATLCTADTMGVIRIWDLVKEEGDAPRWKSVLKTELKHHRTGINEVYLAGDQLWTASADETAQLATIKVWDATTKALVSSTDAHLDFVKCLLVLPSLGLLVSGSSDKIVRFWDISSVAEGTPLTSMGSISSHTRPISCLAGVAISETSATLCTADTMGVIRIWDLVKEEGDAPRWKSVLKTELKQHRTGINEVYLAGNQLWTASADETAQLAVAFKPTLSIAHPFGVRCILPLSQLSEPYVITGSGDVIRVYDVSSPESPELLNEVDAHWHDVTALQLWMRPWSGGEVPPASMEPWVISTSLDGTIRKWKVADLITAQPRQPPQTKKTKETKAEFEMTEDEERELAELMADD